MSSSVKSFAIKSAKLVALLLVTLFALIWLLSSSVSQHYVTKLLNEYQLTLADKTTIRYNPFRSSLTIRDLEITTVNNTEKPVLAIKSLDVTVSLYRLLTDTLHFSEFNIDGLYLDADLNGETPTVGGFIIANNSNDTSSSVKESKEAKTLEANQTNNETIDYQLSLPNFSLTNAVFDINIENSEQEFAINSLVVKNVLASTNAQQAELSLKALINKAPLDIKMNAQLANNQGEINSELTITELALAPFQPFLSAMGTKKNQLAIKGSININSKQSVSITDGVTNINVEKFELNTKGLNAIQKRKTVALNIAPFSINDLSVELISDQAPIITGTAKLNVNDIMVYEGKESQLLAKISAIDINEINIATLQSLITASIPNVIVEQAIFAENTTDELPPLAKFKNLAISNIKVSQQGLSVDNINLLGLGIDTNLDKDKNLIGLLIAADEEITEELTTKEESKQSETQTTTGKEEAAFALSINNFSLVETSHITFTDRSTTPNYTRDFDITKFNAGPFDNQKPQQDSLFRLEGSSNKYAYFELSAIAKPFSDKDFYHLEGLFKEVSLPALSTYISEALQYELKSGQLDVELDITIDDTDIDGNAILHLRGVELGAANDHEADTVKSQTSVPFNIALGMLKDGDGNVELDIPLEGSTNDPSFGMRGFISLMIKQATMSAAREYLLTTFVPYANVVNVAISASDYLLKVRFNDLAFPVKETELNEEQSPFLTQFSSLMNDKPETQLTLCAIATPEDINKPLGVEITDKSEIKKLADISAKRLDAFKDYMVNEKGIASNRLLLCSAKIDFSMDAKPRMTFTD